MGLGNSPKCPVFPSLHPIDTPRDPLGPALAYTVAQAASGLPAASLPPATTTMRTHHLTRPASLALLAGALLCLLPAVASAGTGAPCSSSKAATQLSKCAGCSAMKTALKGCKAQVELEVLELRSGVVVRVEGEDEAAREAARQLGSLVWMAGAGDTLPAGSGEFCGHCADRTAALAAAERESAPTARGMLVVLTSEDAERVAWLKQDARQQREFLQGILDRP